MRARIPIVILGAGPAGLGAALQLARRGCFDVTVVERASEVGGNAGSFEIEGLRVDYGSHRLHPACPPPIMADIQAMLGKELLERPRHGRIRLRGRWVHFPLKPADLAVNLPPGFLLGVLRDAMMRLGRPFRQGDNFQTALELGLGRTICRDFYFPYARKIWGVLPSALDAEQARRRVSAGSLGKMVRKVLNAVPGFRSNGGGRFFYPRDGYGAISEAYCREALRAGTALKLRTSVTGVELENGRAVAVRTHSEEGDARLPARQILSTIPVTALARAVCPSPPAAVLSAASALKFRAMILVYLVLDVDRFTEYDAHYFPDAQVRITRLSEPKNYSLAPMPGKTVLCAELPCSTDDSVWSSSDGALGQLVVDALAAVDLRLTVPVRQVIIRRLPQAYPIYSRDYRQHFDRLDQWVNDINGLVAFGRQGLFAHDNTHHTLAMAYALNECLDDDAGLNRQKWQGFRQSFQQHVVED